MDPSGPYGEIRFGRVIPRFSYPPPLPPSQCLPPPHPPSTPDLTGRYSIARNKTEADYTQRFVMRKSRGRRSDIGWQAGAAASESKNTVDNWLDISC